MPPPIIAKKNETQICPSATVRYLYQPEEQEGGGNRRATNPLWSVGNNTLLSKTASSKGRFCKRRITYCSE